MSSPREGEVTRAFVSLASSLVNGYDVIDLLSGLTEDCARLLDVASAGVLLSDSQGVLQVLAASSEPTRQLEVFQLEHADGPCRDCYHEGAPVSVSDLEQEVRRWPQFVPAALAAGFASVHTMPMRLGDHVLGAMGLFGATVGALSQEDLALGQALADVASVALVQDKAVSDRTKVNDQLQTALSTRVVLEQAKGVLAQKGGLEMGEAFAVLRRYARNRNLRLTDVAQAVASRTLPAQRLIESARS